METRKQKQEKALEDVFGNAAKAVRSPGFYNRAKSDLDEYEDGKERWPRVSDSAEPGDEYGHAVKPASKHWESPPLSEADKAIYYGYHIHSESNPLGLHTHLKGGMSGGAHTHGPQNRLGGHTHKNIDLKDKQYPGGYSIDGHHYHDYNENKPGGPHTHNPENFA